MVDNNDRVDVDDLEMTEEDLNELSYKPTTKKEDTGEEGKPENKDTEEDIEEEETDEETAEDTADRDTKLAIANAKWLEEQGILESAEGVTTLEGLKEKIVGSKNKLIDDYLDSLPLELAEQIKAFEKGIDINEVRGTVSTLASLKTLSDDTLKKDKVVSEKLYRELLALEGNDQEYIDEMITLAKDSDTIGKQGVRAKSRMLQAHAAELARKEEQAKITNEANKKVQNEWATNLNSAIDGDTGIWDIKLSNKEKKELKAILFDAVETKLINGQKVSMTKIQKFIEDDPTVLVQIALGIQKGMFGKEGKLTFAQSKAKKSVMEELERAMEVKARSKDSSSNGEGKESIANYEKSMKSITKMFDTLKL